jgi:hypothetical protein
MKNQINKDEFNSYDKNHGLQVSTYLPVKTREEMAREYGISVRTFRRWLIREHLDLPNGLIYPRWQAIIYDTFGLPKNMVKE